MFCFKCGRQLDDGFNFCPKCGTDLSALKENLTTDISTEENNTPESYETTDVFTTHYSSQVNKPFYIVDNVQNESNTVKAEYEKLCALPIDFVDVIELSNPSQITDTLRAQICQNKIAKLIINFDGPYIKEDGSENLFFNPLLKEINFEIEIGSNVTDASGLFFGCCELKTVKTETNFSHIKKAEMMFTCCYSLQTIPVKNISHIPQISVEFSELKNNLVLKDLSPEVCEILVGAEIIKSYELSENQEYKKFIDNKRNQEALRRNPVLQSEADITPQILEDIANGYLSSITFKTAFFENSNNNPFYILRDKISEINFSINLDQSIKSVKNLFSGCYKLKKFPKIHVMSVVDFTAMCKDCVELEEFPDLSCISAENTTEMFMNCKALKSIPNIIFQKLKHADRMFMNCESLEEITNFDISELLTAKDIVAGCSALKTAFTYSYGVKTEMRKLSYIDKYLAGL